MKEKAGVVVVNDSVSTRVGDSIVTGSVTGVATPSGAKLSFELSGVRGAGGGEVEVSGDGSAVVTVYGSGENAEPAEEVGKKIASSLGASPAKITVTRSGETLLSEVRRDAEKVRVIPSGMLSVEEDADLKSFRDKYGLLPDFVLEIVGRDKERWYLFRRLPDALEQLARKSAGVMLGLKPSVTPVVGVLQMPEVSLMPEVSTGLVLRTDQVAIGSQNGIPVVRVRPPPLVPVIVTPSGAPAAGGAGASEKLRFRQREKLVI
jgi:hypothetical protein